MLDRTGSTYKAFDVVVQSTTDLPELEEYAAQAGDITLAMGPTTMLPVEFNWFHHWYADDLKTIIAFSIAREACGYRIRFPALADFLISDNGQRVECEPGTDTSPETVRHLFLDQVLPRILGQRGDLVLHASAVETADGSGIAFVGNSGWGKSTLASGFQEECGRFLGDDCLKFKISDGELVGVSAYLGARLWEDSIEALYPTGVDTGRVSQYSDKRRIIFGLPESVRRTVFKHVFFLQDPHDCDDNDIHIERFRGESAIMGLIKRSFVLDVENVRAAAQHFAIIGDLLATGPVFYTLQYPRRFSRLRNVRRAILTAVLSNETGSDLP